MDTDEWMTERNGTALGRQLGIPTPARVTSHATRKLSGGENKTKTGEARMERRRDE